MSASAEIPVSPYTKDAPFPARVTEARLLNQPGSGKETRHFVVSIVGSGLHYTAGDSLGVFPANPAGEVEEILERLGVSGEDEVRVPRVDGPIRLREALTRRLALSGPTRKFVEALAARASAPEEKSRLSGLLGPESAALLAEYLAEREFVDLLAEYPSARFSAQEFADHLRRLMPRLYSIASSPRLHPTEVHLTVAVVRYRTNGRDRTGTCSTFLADRVQVGNTLVPVFVSHSRFGPPGDPAMDAIMVGPGTGVAPFRAFMQDRAGAGGTGRNWLFFGEQHRATDYLYEEEWGRHLADGTLTRLDLAFSRDQAQKIYVQDRMREHATDLWSWIRGGAAFYVCGDAKRMAKDVDTALLDIVAEQGRMPPQEAADYVRA
ncbi:MAG: diflavin oxidoreductase, partial [Opitutaceae bacterium]